MSNKQKFLERCIAAARNVARRAQEAADDPTADTETREADQWLAEFETDAAARNQEKLDKLIEWKKQHGYPT